MIVARTPFAATLIVFLHVSATMAKGALVGGPGACFSACQLSLNYVQFADMGGPPTWGNKIASHDYMTSLVACMSAYCSPEGIEAGWERFHEMRDLGAPGTPLPDYADVLTTVPHHLPEIDTIAHPGTLVNGTVRVARSNFDDGYRTDTVFARQLDLHKFFGQCMYALLAVMTLIGFGNRVLAYAARRGAVRWTGNVLAPWPRLYARYRRHIGTPAMMGYRNAQPWGLFTIPTRLQAIMIFIYVALNIAMGCYGYETFDHNLFWLHREDLQLARYVADRTGIMSFYNMVLLWLLAGRNDVVLWLTGWSYPSLNLFHRWAARVAVTQGLVHSIGYAYMKYGHFWAMMEERYWWSGVYGMLAMGALIPLSLLPLRRYAYEAFLLLHIGLSVATSALLCIHTDLFGYDPFVWLCVGIWLFDRTLRLLRVTVLSYRTLGARNAVGVVTAIEPGLMRLSVDTSVPISPRPGDYYFLYSPHSLTPWENHPFTLASWDEHPGQTTLHFLIAPQGGWTGRLRKRIEAAAARKSASEPSETTALLAAAQPQAHLRVLLEGPYGTRDPVDEFDHVLLLAGGSGIAAILPYVAMLANPPEDGVKAPKARRVSVVWTVRNAAYAADVLQRELAPERTSHISLDIYLTKEEPVDARACLRG